MNPKIDFRQAEAKFSATIREYLEYSKKEATSELNRRAKNVILKSISRTKKAERAAVKAALETDGLAYKLIKKTGLTRPEIKRKARALISARLKSLGYIKAGWYKAAQAFGGRGGKTKPGGLAEQGKGTKATERKLTATFENLAVGATEVGQDALAAAMDAERADMMTYIARKLREKWGSRR